MTLLQMIESGDTSGLLIMASIFFFVVIMFVRVSSSAKKRQISSGNSMANGNLPEIPVTNINTANVKPAVYTAIIAAVHEYKKTHL